MGHASSSVKLSCNNRPVVMTGCMLVFKVTAAAVYQGVIVCMFELRTYRMFNLLIQLDRLSVRPSSDFLGNVRLCSALGRRRLVNKAFCAVTLGVTAAAMHSMHALHVTYIPFI